MCRLCLYLAFDGIILLMLCFIYADCLSKDRKVGSMDKRLRGRLELVINVCPRATQPPTLSGTGNKHQPKDGDALRPGQL